MKTRGSSIQRWVLAIIITIMVWRECARGVHMALRPVIDVMIAMSKLRVCREYLEQHHL